MGKFDGMINKEGGLRAIRRLYTAASLAALESQELKETSALKDDMQDKKGRTFMSALMRALQENPEVVAALSKAKKSPSAFKEAWDKLGDRVIDLRDK